MEQKKSDVVFSKTLEFNIIEDSIDEYNVCLEYSYDRTAYGADEQITLANIVSDVKVNGEDISCLIGYCSQSNLLPTCGKSFKNGWNNKSYSTNPDSDDIGEYTGRLILQLLEFL